MLVKRATIIDYFSNNHLVEEKRATVLPAKSDSDVMFRLQKYQ